MCSYRYLLMEKVTRVSSKFCWIIEVMRELKPPQTFYYKKKKQASVTRNFEKSNWVLAVSSIVKTHPIKKLLIIIFLFPFQRSAIFQLFTVPNGTFPRSNGHIVHLLTLKTVWHRQWCRRIYAWMHNWYDTKLQ